MRRYGRRDKVVPFLEVVVEEDLFAGPSLESGKDFPLGQKYLVDDFGEDLQSVLRHGVCGPSASVDGGVERGSVPGVCYLGEEPVLDGVELGAVGWIVHDEDLHPGSVCDVHKVLIHNVVYAGVGTAAIAEDDE